MSTRQPSWAAWRASARSSSPYELARKLAAKLSLANHAKDLAPFRFERGDAQAPFDRLTSPHLGIFLARPHPAFDPLAVAVHDPRGSRHIEIGIRPALGQFMLDLLDPGDGRFGRFDARGIFDALLVMLGRHAQAAQQDGKAKARDQQRDYDDPHRQENGEVAPREGRPIAEHER